MGIYNLGGGGSAPTLEARTVTPSTSQQIIKPSRDEYDGLSQVTVEATPLETRTVNPSTSSQTITPSGSNIGFSTITVNPYRLQSKNVTPSTVPYTVSPDSGYNGLSGVTFGRDTNLTAENIVKGKTIYGVTGSQVRYQSQIAYGTSRATYTLSTGVSVTGIALAVSSKHIIGIRIKTMGTSVGKLMIASIYQWNDIPIITTSSSTVSGIIIPYQTSYSSANIENFYFVQSGTDSVYICVETNKFDNIFFADSQYEMITLYYD